MTKKIFAMFLALLMVVSLLPTSVFAADCPYKGTGLHTAKNCDNTVIGEPVAPTCNTPGFTAYKCNACGDEFHDNVTPATGAHTWVDKGTIAPTCEKVGYAEAKECSVCHKVEGKNEIPSLSKGKYNCQWEITNPQINCLTGGEQIWKCVNCGDEKTVTIDKKAAHTWGDFKLVIAATATTNGLAKRTCACGAVDEVVVYFDHDCHDFLIEIKGYEATCTTDGLKAHFECRTCGNKFDKKTYTTPNTAEQNAKLIIKASHTYDCPVGCQKTADHGNGKAHVATCVDTKLNCSVCKKTVDVNVGHQYQSDTSKWTVGAQATCTKSGYITDTCANCGIAVDTKTVAALGHKTVEIAVPATCSTYAYTFTFCTRAGCDAAVITETANADYALALGDERYNLDVHKFEFNNSAPAVGTGYYMALDQKGLGTVLYFTGNMSGDYLKTSHDYRDAVKVYVEKVHLLDTKGEFLMYFYNDEDVKTYISVEGYTYFKNGQEKAGGKVKLTTTVPSTVWTWNAEKSVLATEVECKKDWTETFFLNAYNSYDTIGASFISYATSNTTYRASFVDTKATRIPSVYAFTMNKDAGTNAENHGTWNYEVVTAATCTTNGVKMATCTFCGSYHEETISAAHTWIVATDDQVPGKTEKAFQDVGCVDGWQWYICSVQGCGATKKVTTTGSGHVYGAVVEFEPDHINTTGNDTKTCKYCGDVVKLTYRVWEYIGVQFESLADAKEAHGETSLTLDKVLSTGNCTTTGLTRYTCSGCNKSVLVKTEGKHTPPAEINGIPVYQAPTCIDKGWTLTYECTVCKEIVGAKALGEKNDIPALGHDYKVAKDHECADCDTPDYNEIHMTCSRCKDTVPCFKEISISAVNSGEELCEKTVMEYYWCEKCQDEHIRSFVKAMGHEWKAVTKLDEKGNVVIDYIKAPTCTETGTYTEKCDICGKTREAIAPTVAHVNKAKEPFFNKCTDTVTDRHCVVCCACTNKGASHDCTADQDKNTAGIQTCNCVIKAEHQYNSVLMPSNCSMPPYLAQTCPDCGDRTNKVVTSEFVYEYKNTAAEGEEANYEWVKSAEKQTIDFKGHKPAAIDLIPEIGEDGKPTGNMVEVKYPGFTYEEYTHVWYTVVDGNLYKNTETYTAKFIERKAASYTEEGYDHFYCQICKSEEKNMKAKLTGLGFEFEVMNALGGKEFTYGSLVEVIVSVNGNNAAVHGFNFDVTVSNAIAGAKFVGYETMNDDFNLVVLKPENTLSKATISGFAANNASGKQQNITINGKTELVKLYFRIADKAFVSASTLTAKFETKAEAVTVLKDGKAVDVTANTNILNKDFKTRGFLNFNNDDMANTKDLQMAMSMITLEHVDGKTYDVTVDVNKDGVVDLEDLSIAYNYVVGNYDLVDLLVMGLSAEEVVLLNLVEKVTCNSSTCDAELNVDDNYCPVCGNRQ